LPLHRGTRCRIWGSHTCGSTCCLLHTGCFFRLFFDPEYGTYMLLRNVGLLLTDYTALHLRRWSLKNSPVKQLFICLMFIFFFLWLYSPPLGLGLPPWNFPFHFSLLDLGHSVGLLGRVISSSQGFYLLTNTEKRTYTNTKHPCPEWDSNPRSRRTKRKHATARLPWPAWWSSYAVETCRSVDYIAHQQSTNTTRSFTLQTVCANEISNQCKRGLRGSVVGWGTTLQADEVIRFCSWSNPSSRIRALGSTQLLTECVQGIFLGVKGGRAARKADLTAICEQIA
jgi:hypothetical protein